MVLQVERAWIVTVTFPSNIFTLYENPDEFELDSILSGRTVAWHWPCGAKPDDVVFFYYDDAAGERIEKVRRQLTTYCSQFSEEEHDRLHSMLNRAEKQFDTYGGQIFAIGYIGSDFMYKGPFSSEMLRKEPLGWFVDVRGLFVLDELVGRDMLCGFVDIDTKLGVTELDRYQLSGVRALTMWDNAIVPRWYRDAVFVEQDLGG